MKATSKKDKPKTVGYWSGRSDAELLAHDFYSADPSKLENLLNEVPVTPEVPEVEFTYNTLITGTGQVRCIHCKVSAVNHNRGFVLRFADGRRMLFGRNCGENVYGEAFGARRLDFDHALKRHGLLKRRERILAERERLISALEHIEAHPSWRAFAELKRGFNVAFPDIAAHVAEAVERRDGGLYGEQKVRDSEAEQRYRIKNKRDVVLYKTIETVIHRVLGAGFFAPRKHPDLIVPNLCLRARNALWVLGDTQTGSRDIEVWLRGMSTVVGQLRDEASRFSDLRAAFSPANIGGLATWLSSQSLGYGELRLEGGRLHLSNRHGEVRTYYSNQESPRLRRAEMTIPSEMPEPPLAMIEELARALAEGIAEQVRK